MNEAIPEFTENEISALMVLAQGTGLLALGNWEKPLKSLVTRGFAKPRKISTFDPSNNIVQAYDYVITDAGKSACEAWENQSLMDVIKANNAVAERRPFESTVMPSPTVDIPMPKGAKPFNIGGFTEHQVRALADFYWKMTGRNPAEICPP